MVLVVTDLGASDEISTSEQAVQWTWRQCNRAIENLAVNNWGPARCGVECGMMRDTDDDDDRNEDG